MVSRKTESADESTIYRDRERESTHTPNGRKTMISLKDFPKCVDGECDGFAACKWKKSFEKELREMDNDSRADRVIKIKEILGE